MLKKALDHTKKHDEFTKTNTELNYTSPFFNKMGYAVKDRYKTGISTTVEDFCSALQIELFTALRGRKDFKKIFNDLYYLIKTAIPKQMKISKNLPVILKMLCDIILLRGQKSTRLKLF